MSIPGLSLIVDNEEDEGERIQVHSFTGSFSVPESHLRGNCRPRSALVKLGTIYEGDFASVYKCKDLRNDQIYALKKYVLATEMKEEGMPKSFLREINVLKLLKHDNIVNFHEVIAARLIESNFLLLDYCVISLHDLIEKDCTAIYERDVVKYIMMQLFDAISYLHKSSVVHRNISCRNLLFTECGVLKISGFRTAQFLNRKGMSPVITELVFRAPEVLFQANYGLPVDLWSAGCVFSHLLLKRQLFSGATELKVLASIFEAIGTPSEKIWPGFNEIYRNFTKGEINSEKPYSNLKIIFDGVSQFSFQVINKLIMYNPPLRMKASDVLLSPYIVDTPPECSPEKMMSIIKNYVPNLPDVPMNIDT